jgi:hypothetical protein
MMENVPMPENPEHPFRPSSHPTMAMGMTKQSTTLYYALCLLLVLLALQAVTSS